MRIIVNADDCGLTRGITDTILEAVDKGALSSVSVVPNGSAFAHAVAELNRRPHVRVGAHLNLVEGTPVSPAGTIPLLVDSQGQLRNTFVSLWWQYRRGGAEARSALAAQVKLELRAQLCTFSESLSRDELNVDSHQHFHMIPFVFQAVLELAEEFPIRYVRLPRERFVRPQGWSELPVFASSNAVKFHLLNWLSARARPSLVRAGIAHSDRFVGVLFSGCMKESVVRRALAGLDTRDRSAALVEVLLHPGEAAAHEIGYWRGRPELERYYFSPWRARERRALLAPSFSELITSHHRK